MGINYSKLKFNKKYKCRLKSVSGRIVEEELIYVDEDDNSWRTADDNSEISNAWTVIEVIE